MDRLQSLITCPATAGNAKSSELGSDVAEGAFRQAFMQAAVGLALLDLNGQVKSANRTLCGLLGLGEATLQSCGFSSLLQADYRDAFTQKLNGLASGQTSSAQFECQCLHASGRLLDLLITMSLICDDPGTPLYVHLHVQDVSDQRRLGLLESDCRRVLEMVAQDQPLPSMLYELVRLVERQLPGMWACVMVLQDGTIRPFAPSLPQEFTNALNRHPVTFASRLAAGAMGEGASPRVADVETDPAWEGLRAESRATGVKCCWAVTIAGNDAVPLGILVVFSSENRQPGTVECAVLGTAGRLATIGVEHHLTTRQLAHLVRHDPLTSLPNRILFEDRLDHAIAAARRTARPLALLAMDMNRFKQVNDTLGHQAGDAMLQQFAQCVKRCLRESDTLARVGGDEFMLILPELTSPGEADFVANRIRTALAETPFILVGKSIVASCSIGIAVFPTDGEDAPHLQRAADAAMYRVKEQSRRG